MSYDLPSCNNPNKEKEDMYTETCFKVCATGERRWIYVTREERRKGCCGSVMGLKTSTGKSQSAVIN